MSDLVVISLEAWDEVWRRNQHLVAGLLRTGAVGRVLFVEPPVDSLHELRSGRRPQLGRPGLRRVRLEGSPGELWALRPRKLLPRKADPRGDERRAWRVARVAHRIGMAEPVLWVNDPGGAAVLGVTGWPALYDVTDDWLLADRPAAELRRLRRQEAELLTRCREVVVCSAALQRTKSTQRDVVLIPNAVDLDAYRTRHPRPADLPSGPVALYLGTAHRDRIDVELVARTAAAVRHRAGGTVVLVGPALLPREDLSRLETAGVAVLGPRPSGAVPAYLQHADVLVVPHVLTDFTLSLDPIKAYEYRSARRPVVSTPVPGFADSADPLVCTVTAEDFPVVVLKAMGKVGAWSAELPNDIPSWEQRVVQMREVVIRVAGGSR